jgi:eukaryotic-like serine/threonine-protein kinase
MLASARTELLETRPALGGGLSAFTTLSLDALSEHSAELLARELLRGHAISPADFERIRDAAGGNPLFIEELASSVAEGTTDPTRSLPTSVVSIIAARIDALPARERQVLLNASVIGQTFWRSLLAGLEQAPGLDDALVALESREFIRRQRTSEIEGDDAYAFRHGSLREVCYNTLPKAERRERHATVARLAEEAFVERPSTLAPIMALHWQEAGDPQRAVDYLMAAAERADQAWAKQEAIALYSQVLDMLDADDTRRRSVSLRRALANQAMSHIRYGDVPAPSRVVGDSVPG